MTDPNQPQKYRLRLTFAKNNAVKYISHLDLMLAWERALRRAGIPLAYSEGFNPRPKIQAASGLPLGTTGSAEILDIIITQPVDPAEALRRIGPALPAGLAVHTVEEIPLKAPTLQNLLRQADYEVMVETDLSAEALNQRIARLLAADSILQNRQRKGKTEQFDLRPWLHHLYLLQTDGHTATLQMRLTAGQHGDLRPESVLAALGLSDSWVEVNRTRLIFEDDLPPAE